MRTHSSVSVGGIPVFAAEGKGMEGGEEKQLGTKWEAKLECGGFLTCLYTKLS